MASSGHTRLDGAKLLSAHQLTIICTLQGGLTRWLRMVGTITRTIRWYSTKSWSRTAILVSLHKYTHSFAFLPDIFISFHVVLIPQAPEAVLDPNPIVSQN